MDRVPFKVFVSSPVDGIEPYRRAVAEAAQLTNTDSIFNPMFHVFLYEQHETKMNPELTISENITRTFGDHCDAFIVFFKDRIGAGTLEEFDVFESHFLANNDQCKLWWAQIHCEQTPSDVNDFRGRLLKHCIEMRASASQLTIEAPNHLKDRVVVRLFSLLHG